MSDDDSDEGVTILLFIVAIGVFFVISLSLSELISFILNIKISIFLSGIYISIGEILLLLLFLLVFISIYLIAYRGFHLDHLRFRCKHPLTSITGILTNKKIKKLKQEK